MYKTIILSVLIVVVINYIIHFLKNSFTEPIVKYIPDVSKTIPMDSPIDATIDPPDMKGELSTFLMTINI